LPAPSEAWEATALTEEGWGGFVAKVVNTHYTGKHISLAGIKVKKRGDFEEAVLFPYVFISGAVFSFIKRDILGVESMDRVSDEDFEKVFKCVSSYRVPYSFGNVRFSAHSEKAAYFCALCELDAAFIADDESVEEVVLVIYNIKEPCPHCCKFFSGNAAGTLSRVRFRGLPVGIEVHSWEDNKWRAFP
jgi:hypothetical protein